MTIKELVKLLKDFDQDLVVICQGSEEDSEPSPMFRILPFDVSYWQGTNLITVPKDVPHIVL